MDSFFQELMADPAATGYVVIYPRKNNPNEGISLEKHVKGFIYFRNFDKTRIMIERGEEMSESRLQFWRVPAGAEEPRFREGYWEAPQRNLSKAFIFSTISSVDDICPTFAPDAYTDLLIANPDTRGHIVIFNRSKREGRKEAEKWIKLFTEDGKIAKSRFKVFFSKNKGIPDAEFWVVPVKRLRQEHVR